jgi:hypothetical protein
MSEDLAAWEKSRRESREKDNRAAEKKFGRERLRLSIDCPECQRPCLVQMEICHTVEGLKYQPPRVQEFATCFHCEDPYFYVHIHQTGTIVHEPR